MCQRSACGRELEKPRKPTQVQDECPHAQVWPSVKSRAISSYLNDNFCQSVQTISTRRPQNEIKG